jgi:hypothetical protein
MSTQHISFVLPPYGTATLALPEVLTPEAFARLDAAVGSALQEPSLCGSVHTAHTTHPANDPGTLEVASWWRQHA